MVNMANDLAGLVMRSMRYIDEAVEANEELCEEMVRKLSTVIPDIRCDGVSADAIYLESDSRSAREMLRKYGDEFADNIVELTAVLNTRYNAPIFMTWGGVYVTRGELKRIGEILGWDK